MMADLLLVEDHGPVRILRLNRPAKLNALNTELALALCDALDACERDALVRAVLLCGEGRAFCAGADMSEVASLKSSQVEIEARAEISLRVHSTIPSMRKPVVSVVQGAAVGGGAGLAIGCDMMVVSTDVKFGFTEIRHGLVPALVMAILQRNIGRKLAFDLISTGRTLGATELLAAGIANRVAEPEDAFSTGLDIATGWAESDGTALQMTKSLFLRVGETTFAEAMAASRDANVAVRRARVGSSHDTGSRTDQLST